MRGLLNKFVTFGLFSCSNFLLKLNFILTERHHKKLNKVSEKIKCLSFSKINFAI